MRRRCRDYVCLSAVASSSDEPAATCDYRFARSLSSRNQRLVLACLVLLSPLVADGDLVPGRDEIEVDAWEDHRDLPSALIDPAAGAAGRGSAGQLDLVAHVDRAAGG